MAMRTRTLDEIIVSLNRERLSRQARLNMAALHLSNALNAMMTTVHLVKPAPDTRFDEIAAAIETLKNCATIPTAPPLLLRRPHFRRKPAPAVKAPSESVPQNLQAAAEALVLKFTRNKSPITAASPVQKLSLNAELNASEDCEMSTAIAVKNGQITVTVVSPPRSPRSSSPVSPVSPTTSPARREKRLEREERVVAETQDVPLNPGLHKRFDKTSRALAESVRRLNAHAGRSPQGPFSTDTGDDAPHQGASMAANRQILSSLNRLNQGRSVLSTSG